VKNLSANVRKLRDVEKEDEEKKTGGDDIKKFLMQNG